MKIDVSKIAGYESMSAEEKLKALEGFDIPDPDYSGYVKKEEYDKTASELSQKKKELEAKMSADELAQKKAQEAQEELQKKYDLLLHETAVSKNKAELLALGYEDKLADETAEAMANGDITTVLKNQKKHLDSFEKKVRAEALKNTPKPTGDGGDPKTVTLKDLRAMSPQERYDFSVNHPDEYKSLYGGNE